MRVHLFALLCLATAACTDFEPSNPEILEVTFPKGFVWGTATAAFQVEKGLGDTDWGVFASTPGNIADGDLPEDGPDFFAHVDDDVGRMAELGTTGYRFGIEMARLYPTRQEFDDDTPSAEGLALYDDLLAKLAAKGVRPMVTLHHFSWPSYMSDPTKPDEPQGFERSDAVQVLATYCDRMAARYGDRVDLWITINEPLVEATVGYLAATWPPGVSNVDRAVGVMNQQVEAHARCYDRLHASDGTDADGDGVKVAVSVAQHDRVYEPADPASDADLAAAEHSRRFWNQWFMDAIIRGDVDEDFDDVLGDGDRIADPTLSARADFYGLNYYGASTVDSRSLKLPFMGNFPAQFNVPNGRPKNDLGWDIYPAGFGKVLDEAWAYGLPIHVTENGTADGTNQNRPRFLLEHALEMGKATRRGVDVRAYYHWSLIDNFEWASGYCPEFGLYRVDYGSPERTRTPSAAVPVFQKLATSNHVSQTEIDATGPYVSKAKECAGF